MAALTQLANQYDSDSLPCLSNATLNARLLIAEFLAMFKNAHSYRN